MRVQTCCATFSGIILALAKTLDKLKRYYIIALVAFIFYAVFYCAWAVAKVTIRLKVHAIDYIQDRSREIFAIYRITLVIGFRSRSIR